MSSLLVLNDHNAWYYPSQGFSSDDEDLAVSIVGGNWGNKTRKGSRWVRKGKMAAWGPGMDEWEVSLFIFHLDTLNLQPGRGPCPKTH